MTAAIGDSDVGVTVDCTVGKYAGVYLHFLIAVWTLHNSFLLKLLLLTPCQLLSNGRTDEGGFVRGKFGEVEGVDHRTDADIGPVF